MVIQFGRDLLRPVILRPPPSFPLFKGEEPPSPPLSQKKKEERKPPRRQPATNFPTRSHLVPEVRQRIHSLITRAEWTRDVLFTNKDKRIQRSSAAMFAVYLCPTHNTLFLTTVEKGCNLQG